jgi:hypothetical protein
MTKHTIRGKSAPVRLSWLAHWVTSSKGRYSIDRAALDQFKEEATGRPGRGQFLSFCDEYTTYISYSH